MTTNPSVTEHSRHPYPLVHIARTVVCSNICQYVLNLNRVRRTEVIMAIIYNKGRRFACY